MKITKEKLEAILQQVWQIATKNVRIVNQKPQSARKVPISLNVAENLAKNPLGCWPVLLFNQQAQHSDNPKDYKDLVCKCKA